jgi:ferredoxin
MLIMKCKYNKDKLGYAMGLFSKHIKKKHFMLCIEGLDEKIELTSNHTVLETVLSMGVNFPHSCKVGSCTRCKCKVTQGKAKSLTDLSYVLTLAEIRSGIMLTCQMIAQEDLCIEVMHESWQDSPKYIFEFNDDIDV